MTEPNHPPRIHSSVNEDGFNDGPEISLLDIVNFLQGAWKKLAIAAVVGAFLGLGVWFFLGQYSAEYTLLNNTNTNTNSYGLDLASWKIIQNSLPNLAAQVLEEGNPPDGQVGLYQTIANDQWWQKNVVPSYVLSKADIKDWGGVSKEFDGASTTILSFTLSAGGPSKEKASESVKAAAKFLRTGGAYLQLRNLLGAYESDVINAAAEIEKKITTTQIEMGYQQQRAKSLEDLYKRYPSNSSVGQIVDLKESGTKYLSITTQIIAANNDINQSKENQQRMRDRLAQLALIKTFLDEALPLAKTTFDGLILGGELLAIEAKLRNKLAQDDAKQHEVLDQIHSQLLMIQTRFTKGLKATLAPTSSGKKGKIKATAGGLAGGFFLMFLVLLGQRVWVSFKSGSVKS